MNDGAVQISDQDAGFDDGNQVCVDGIRDEARGIVYWGKATKQPSGAWTCLANVAGSLCVVEVQIGVWRRE